MLTGYVTVKPAAFDVDGRPGAVIARLRALGYDGYANSESGPWDLPDRADGCRHAIDCWRACERIALA